MMILLLRLFNLQVVKGEEYTNKLINQHFSTSTLNAERGHVFMVDRTGKKIQLTQNIELFTLFVDPHFVEDKERVIDFLTPLVYEHLCVHYGVDLQDRYDCMRNLENYAWVELLPEKQVVYYYSGVQQAALAAIEEEGADAGERADLSIEIAVAMNEFDRELQDAMEAFTPEQWRQIIRERLEHIIVRGIKPTNYIGFFEDAALLEELADADLPYLEIHNQYYVYVRPERVPDAQRAAQRVASIFQRHGYAYSADSMRRLFVPQENRYVRIATNMNAKLAKVVRDARRDFAREMINGIPIYHGLGLETYERRYYPYGEFAAHLLGYMTKDGRAQYGIEEYYDHILAGQDGQIIGLSTPWIGQVWSNSVDIIDPQPGQDVYLTIDPHIQREAERILATYYEEFWPDTMSMTIIEPESGHIKAMASYPSFNPNTYQDAYRLRPVTPEESYIAEDLSYIDWPLFVQDGDELRPALVDERLDPSYRKYMFANGLGPQIFINNNISRAYEPGSIFKTITAAIAVDSDSVSMYDFYHDPGEVMVWPFRISNISTACPWYHNYMHAVAFSCNVGMVRMGQQMTKYPFYNYLERLGFGELSHIQLAGEDPGSVPDVNTVSVAWFFNNTFGQGLLATPIQVVSAFAAMANGGTYIAPSIVQASHNHAFDTLVPHTPKTTYQVFSPETSDISRQTMAFTLKEGQMRPLASVWFDLWGKTGTSEIAFRGRYRGDLWRTNASLVGLVNMHDPKYIVMIQVRRPRTTRWWMDVNGDIFKDTATFLLAYDNFVEVEPLEPTQ